MPPGGFYLQDTSFWTSFYLLSGCKGSFFVVLAMSDQDPRVWVQQALSKSKDESDLWRLGEPAVCLPEALETLFTAGTNSGPEEMAR